MNPEPQGQCDKVVVVFFPLMIECVILFRLKDFVG